MDDKPELDPSPTDMMQRSMNSKHHFHPAFFRVEDKTLISVYNTILFIVNNRLLNFRPKGDPCRIK